MVNGLTLTPMLMTVTINHFGIPKIMPVRSLGGNIPWIINRLLIIHGYTKLPTCKQANFTLQNSHNSKYGYAIVYLPECLEILVVQWGLAHPR
jgi:hypothetical protein